MPRTTAAKKIYPDWMKQNRWSNATKDAWLAREAKAIAMLGDAFVKLLEDKRPEFAEQRDTAWKMADWLHLHMFTDEQAAEFMDATGIVFDSDNPPEEYLYPQPLRIPPEGDHDDEIPF